METARAPGAFMKRRESEREESCWSRPSRKITPRLILITAARKWRTQSTSCFLHRFYLSVSKSVKCDPFVLVYLLQQDGVQLDIHIEPHCCLSSELLFWTGGSSFFYICFIKYENINVRWRLLKKLLFEAGMCGFVKLAVVLHVIIMWCSSQMNVKSVVLYNFKIRDKKYHYRENVIHQKLQTHGTNYVLRKITNHKTVIGSQFIHFLVNMV